MFSESASIANYKPSNVMIWMLMAFQGGFLNAAGFVACGRFVSHMTGYGTLIAFRLAHAEFNSAVLVCAVPILFLLGAIVSGYYVEVRMMAHKRPQYAFTFGLIFILLFFIFANGVLGGYGTLLEKNENLSDDSLVLLLAFICGIQNATVTSVSRMVIRTTHITGLLTDLGIGVSRLVYQIQKQSSCADDLRANLTRLGILLCFIAGSFVAVLVLARWQFYGFILPLISSGILFMSVVFQSRPLKHR